MKPTATKITLAAAILAAGLPLAATAATDQAQSQAQKPKPCSTKPYRHFDFWLGEWEVKNAKGVVVGHSKITSILGGCAISEAWSSASGYKGVSYNFFDRNKKGWHQTWIGGAGGALYLDGNPEGSNTMILEGQTTTPDGKTTLQKISWRLLENGQVSQHWQVSQDNGKTWKDSFLGFYNKQ